LREENGTPSFPHHFFQSINPICGLKKALNLKVEGKEYLKNKIPPAD